MCVRMCAPLCEIVRLGGRRDKTLPKPSVDSVLHPYTFTFVLTIFRTWARQSKRQIQNQISLHAICRGGSYGKDAGHRKQIELLFLLLKVLWKPLPTLGHPSAGRGISAPRHKPGTERSERRQWGLERKNFFSSLKENPAPRHLGGSVG